ncbi:MAG: hypothetical protein ABW202_20530, partial [Duganella sp.]
MAPTIQQSATIWRHAVKFDTVAAGTYPELVYPPYKSTAKRGPQQPLLRIDA